MLSNILSIISFILSISFDFLNSKGFTFAVQSRKRVTSGAMLTKSLSTRWTQQVKNRYKALVKEIVVALISAQKKDPLVII